MEAVLDVGETCFSVQCGQDFRLETTYLEAMNVIICERLVLNMAHIKLTVLCWKHSSKLCKSSYMFGLLGREREGEGEREGVFVRELLLGFPALRAITETTCMSM